MSPSKSRPRRSLSEGIRCSACHQLAGRCRCGAFFIDPTTMRSPSGIAGLAGLDNLRLTVDSVIEGSITPIGDSSIADAPTSPISNPVSTHPVDDAAISTSAPLRHRSSRRRGGSGTERTLRPALALVGILLLSLLLGTVLFFTLPAPATIAIHPSSGMRSEMISVTAVTTTPASRESQARVLTSTKTSPQLSVRATKIVHLSAAQATGTLTFFNIAPSIQSIGAGIVFNLAGGIQVISDSAVTVPAGNPPDSLGSATVSAHVQQTGALGNIPANVINGLCPCGNAGVSVKNQEAFSGGQDAVTYTVLTQNDINQVANPEQTTLIQQATTSVKAQMRRTERLVSPVSCAPTVQADPPAGSRTTQGQIKVEATCQGEVYDQSDVEVQATAIFRQDMQKVLPRAEVLTGSLTATITHTAISDQRRGTLSFLVQVQGWWMHALDTGWLSQRLAGKTYNDALSLLERTPGVIHATVQQRGGGLLRLPNDPHQITIQIILPVVP